MPSHHRLANCLILIQSYKGEKGRDASGLPLINDVRMDEIWKKQELHLDCIQDPDLDEKDAPLYRELGKISRNGILLPRYRCARGTTSLENFHLDLNRFIPGNNYFIEVYFLYT